MGSELIGDFWLTLFIMPGRKSAGPAHTLLLTQILTERHTGHLIALGEEFPRRAIMRTITHGTLPTVYVRCWRCNATAWLSAWMAAAKLTSIGRAERIDDLRRRHLLDTHAFMLACDGSRYLQDALWTFEEQECNKSPR